MANLLQTATNWKDANNVSPPPEWNGTAYVFTAAGTLTLTATAAEGDTLTADFSGTEQNHGHQIAINVNGVDAITWSGAGSGMLSFPTSIAITLNAGDAVTIVTQNDGCGYAPDFTMTPPAPAVVTPVISDLDIDLRYSKDGSHNWGDWRQQKLGDQGAFNQRAVFRRLGFGRRIVLHVRVSAGKGRDLIAASVDTEAF